MPALNPLVPLNPQVPVVDKSGVITQAFYRFLQRAGFSLMPGDMYANLPASPRTGMVYVVTDSSTNVWGAVISGGGANQVLAWFNGSDWTVIGK